MKNLIALAVVLLTFPAVAQTLSQSESQLHFFKVWNHVKYYHPALASGTINADTLFLENIDIVDKIKNQADFNKFIATFLVKLPTATKKAAKVKGKMHMQNKDTKWYTSARLFTSENKKKLKAIFENRYTDSIHYYIPNIRFSSEIPHEAEYPFPATENIPYPYRMLTAAKIQGAVDYLFPHKYLMDKNFDTLLFEKLPLLTNCTKRQDHEDLLLQLVSAFNDTHAFKLIKQVNYREKIIKNSFFPPFKYVVFDDRIIVTEIVIPEFCTKADIRIGDAILKINNENVSTLVNTIASKISVSNRPTLRRYLSDYIRNLVWQADTKDLNLSMSRNGSETTKAVEFIYNRDAANIKKITEYINTTYPDQRQDGKLDIMPGEIVYFKIGETARFYESVSEDKTYSTMDSLLTIASKHKGIIFDMRSYPDWGGFVAFVYKKFGIAPNRFADYFEINKKEVGTYIINNDPTTYNNPEIIANGSPYKGKVVIIVDPETLSQSEWNTMNLQNIFPQSVTIGEQSAGADGDEKMFMLPGGYKMNFTGNAIFYTNGTNAQRKGVRIDKRLPLTPETLLKSKDYLLDEAIKIIKE